MEASTCRATMETQPPAIGRLLPLVKLTESAIEYLINPVGLLIACRKFGFVIDFVSTPSLQQL